LALQRHYVAAEWRASDTYVSLCTLWGGQMECLPAMGSLENASFDLMIGDIFMPHMRGFESIRVFHERAPSVALIAMSGCQCRRADARIF
jgi:CheY-like chemotaxis protein